jgi:hypothetical protein
MSRGLILELTGDQIIVFPIVTRWTALTVDDMKHLDNMNVHTKEECKAHMKQLRERGLECWECEEIERKLAAYKLRASLAHRKKNRL